MDKARSFLVGNRTSISAATPANREWPTSSAAYELVEECGRGVSATVWRARLRETGEEIAVKLLDLENVNCSLEEIVREAQTMRQQAHPNVLALHCSFVHERQLWMVMPYVAGGSVLNIMKYAYPEGLEEPVIATILKEVLKAMEYMHKQGAIHRDVKAGNILIDSTGQVLLADFGVAATMERGGSWGNQPMARNTFVGTPCWMAPEVMEQTQGYNSLADIWSFGITILELAHGHAPFARLPPMKVLLMTIQSPPPTLENDTGKKHFSKAMRDIVAKCLVKDPTKRPTAAQLLEHKFLKTAHEPTYLVKHLLAGLPPVTERVRLMRTGKGGVPSLQQNQHMAAQSQEAYVRGVSAWNFDVAALKSNAALEGATELATVPEAPELNGLAMRFGDSGSGAVSPVSKPGTPVPGLTAADFPASSLRQPSSQMLTTQSMDRTTLHDPGRPAPNLGRASSTATPGKERHMGHAAALKKKQGRFEVYEGDMNMSPPVHDGAILMEQHMGGHRLPEHMGSQRLPELTTRSGLEAENHVLMKTDSDANKERAKVEKAKSKGRFQIIESDDKARAPKSQMGSADGSRSGVFSPTGTTANSLLPVLERVLNGMGEQHESMKEIVAALQDSDKGKSASLASLLAQNQERNPAELLTSKSEVALLRAENARLQEKIRVMEEESSRLRKEHEGSDHL